MHHLHAHLLGQQGRGLLSARLPARRHGPRPLRLHRLGQRRRRVHHLRPQGEIRHCQHPSGHRERPRLRRVLPVGTLHGRSRRHPLRGPVSAQRRRPRRHAALRVQEHLRVPQWKNLQKNSEGSNRGRRGLGADFARKSEALCQGQGADSGLALHEPESHAPRCANQTCSASK